ncbi:hypothetical protein SUGI_0469450 [Cryptomeria japonica]|nr:hypothetical protein SUGI_0469450 [Cryptomeria japonica]
MEIVPQVGSNHLPLSLSIAQEVTNQKNYFKFQIIWWRDETFLDNLKIWWLEGNIYSGSPSFKFIKRMQFLKSQIKEWNKNTFKNIFPEKGRIEEKLEEIGNKVMQFGMTNKEYEMERIALEYFEDILGSSEKRNTDTQAVIEPLISRSNSDMFVAPYSLEEIKLDTFALHPYKAPGPDGCTVELFEKGWEFMGKDIWAVVEEFRKKHKFVKEMNHTIICLIPKKVDCESMSNYRPISLCNTI